MRSVDSWIQATAMRRLAGVAGCLWIVIVIGGALWQVYLHDLELYNPMVLALLLSGVPLTVVAAVYAAKLAGRTVLKGIALVATLIAVAGGMVHFQARRVEAQEREALELARKAQIDRFRQECIAEGENRDDFDLIWCKLDKERRERLRAEGYSTSVIDSVIERPRKSPP